ncbi:T9SS type B sorting domain-containing protein [Flavobacterium suzhouense]|uniref:Choice-of-anchor L domain-containing protein n=1 Tax=Flavobacterium suzhouense TaxID=1529638 RepID=A0ABW5NVG7_9FLAO
MKKSLLPLCLLGLFGLCKVTAQQHLQVNDSYSAEQLVNALIDNSCAQVSNINIQGSHGNKSYGHFTNGSNTFPFTNGIVLSTGFATSATGPNNSLLSEGSTDWLGDNDLEIALGVSNTINATVLEFDFIPYTDKISFDYIFSSEQYLTSITSQNQCNYTDGFAFLIKEASGNTPYTNLAVVPDTNIPVKVNTVRGLGVCPSANEQYFDSFNDFEHPTNFNGQTVILQAKTDVMPGTTYHIKLVVADQGNNLYDSAIFLGGGSFKNVTDLGADRLFETNNPLCSGETIQLNAFTPNATGYKWYKDDVLQPVTSSTYNITSGGNYSVIVEFGLGCTSTGKIRIEESNPPVVSAYTLIQCDDNNDGITTYNLDLAYNMVTNNDTSLFVYYYLNMNDAQTSSNHITNTASFHNSTPNQIIYAQVMTPYSCFSISPITLVTSNNTLITPSPIDSCDDYGTDDGITIFDLTQRESQILQNLPSGLSLQYFISANDALLAINPIADPQNFINTTPGHQTIYARIYSSGDCYGIVPIELLVYSFGSDLNDEEITLCENKTLILDAGNSYTSYEWSTNPPQYSQRISINEPGNYSVTVTNNHGCAGTKNFIITPSGKATGANVIIDDFKGENNIVTIEPVGNGNYEFSLDDKNYQDINTFNHLPSGKYKAYIRDKNGCGTLELDFFILDYPRFFTPNNDTINDVWTIRYLNFISEAEVYIFDRYGKVITGFKGSGSWDGTLNGKPLPATDYWFVITINSRSIKGHFSLMR